MQPPAGPWKAEPLVHVMPQQLDEVHDGAVEAGPKLRRRASRARVLVRQELRQALGQEQGGGDAVLDCRASFGPESEASEGRERLQGEAPAFQVGLHAHRALVIPRGLEQQRHHPHVRGQGLGVGPGAGQDLEDPGGVHQVGVHTPELIASQGRLHERHAVVPHHICRHELVNLFRLPLAMQVDDDRLGHAPAGLGRAAAQHEAQEHVRDAQGPELRGHGHGQVRQQRDRVAAELFGGAGALDDPEADRLHKGNEKLMSGRTGGRDVCAEQHGRLEQGQVVPIQRLEDVLLEACSYAVEDLQDDVCAHV
mmetsp:Transcript_95899/g.280311  ORF Transcript_95899/g.280311 Transcript_95899/m.280311 type:complete len:309 (-) Transcript_95899:690-1616(-)